MQFTIALFNFIRYPCGLEIILFIYRVHSVNIGLSIFVYAPTINLYFVVYHSLEWDAICESCGGNGVCY
jgi:hypothetical protein